MILFLFMDHLSQRFATVQKAGQDGGHTTGSVFSVSLDVVFLEGEGIGRATSEPVLCFCSPAP